MCGPYRLLPPLSANSRVANHANPDCENPANCTNPDCECADPECRDCINPHTRQPCLTILHPLPDWLKNEDLEVRAQYEKVLGHKFVEVADTNAEDNIMARIYGKPRAGRSKMAVHTSHGKVLIMNERGQRFDHDRETLEMRAQLRSQYEKVVGRKFVEVQVGVNRNGEDKYSEDDKESGIDQADQADETPQTRFPDPLLLSTQRRAAVKKLSEQLRVLQQQEAEKQNKEKQKKEALIEKDEGKIKLSVEQNETTGNNQGKTNKKVKSSLKTSLQNPSQNRNIIKSQTQTATQIPAVKNNTASSSRDQRAKARREAKLSLP